LTLYIVSDIDLIRRAVAGFRQTGNIAPELIPALILCIILTASVSFIISAVIRAKSHKHEFGIDLPANALREVPSVLALVAGSAGK
jgi:hypothetical protein